MRRLRFKFYLAKMDEAARKIVELTSEYVQLNKDFIQSIKDKRPAHVLHTLKERVKTILEEMEYWKKA